jgi:hypothetical protein
MYRRRHQIEDNDKETSNHVSAVITLIIQNMKLIYILFQTDTQQN